MRGAIPFRFAFFAAMPATTRPIPFLQERDLRDVGEPKDKGEEIERRESPSLLDSCHALRDDVAGVIQASREQRRFFKKVPARKKPAASDIPPG